jgi:hypothetical protein
MVSVLIAAALLASAQEFQGANLVVNSGFVRDWDGWSPIWTREEGSAKASLVPGRSDGKRAILVTSTGSKDWAIQQKPLPVTSGDLYEISGWIKGDGGSGSISVVTRDAKGDTMNWALGEVGPRRAGWQHVRRVFAVPEGCQTVQFRLIGNGPGQTWLESPSLLQTGIKSASRGSSLSLSGAGLTLKISADGAMTASTKMGAGWHYRSWPQEFLTKAIKRVDARTADLDVVDLSNDLTMSVRLEVDATSREATIRYQASGPMDGAVSALGTIVTKPGHWVVLPMNEGIRFPVENMAIKDWSMITYGGHGLCMPWSGVYDPTTGAGAMTIIETPNDADVTFKQEDGLLSFQPRWEPSRQSFGYARKLRLVFLDKGGFVAMAKRYRAYAKSTGLFKTLAAKRAVNPNVDRLIGAVNLWNWDMDPVSLCSEMKTMGFDHVLWSRGGNGTEMKAVADLGYLPGRYDIYQDVWDPKNSMSWMPTEGWPEDLVLEPSGDWMKGWAHPDKHADGTITWYQGGVISSGAGLVRAKKKIPAELAQIPYMARFIDTTTASPFREDYNPAHPLSRGQDRANKMALLEFCSKDMKLVTGTETGIDPSVPVVEYYEGMMSLGPYRLPNAGTFMMEYQKPTPDFLKYQVGPTYRIPLWELVYHDCTVAQWYWGDATNKAPEVWDQRDLLNILYGTAPLLMFDKDRWSHNKARMLQTYQNVCKWIRKVGYDEMLSHEDLTFDHTVQKTTWSSGRSVTVNFGEIPFKGIKPMSYAISDK